jgi:hypothetical protein
VSRPWEVNLTSILSKKYLALRTVQPLFLSFVNALNMIKAGSKSLCLSVCQFDVFILQMFTHSPATDSFIKERWRSHLLLHHHAMKTYGEVKVKLHTFLSPAPNHWSVVNFILWPFCLRGKSPRQSKAKLSLCLNKHHAMKTYWGVEV